MNKLTLLWKLQKRFVIREHEYHAAPIHDTPFSLGIALPRQSRRPNEVVGEIELSRTNLKGEKKNI